MTNPQKKTEIIEIWTNLKTKLEKLTYLLKNKGLIKDAVEVYLNQSSSFTTTAGYPFYAQQVEPNIRELAHDYQNIPELFTLTSEQRERLDYGTRRWIISRHYDRQMEKNKQIVKECKELLAKLE